jgi:hypothetical protein
MTTAHIITGGKGNVGKTAFAELLIYSAGKAGHSPTIFDGDHKMQTLAEWHGDEGVTPVVISDDPSLQDQPDIIWDVMINETCDVIIDLAAQSDHLLSGWMKDRGVHIAAKSKQIQIIKWWIADLNVPSIIELENSIKEFPDIKHVLVKNLYRARPEMWTAFIKSNKVVSEAISSGLKTIEFNRMFVGVMDRLRENKMTFADAIADEKHDRIDMLDRSTVMSWVKDASAQIKPVYEFKPCKPAEVSPEPEADSKKKDAKAKS